MWKESSDENISSNVHSILERYYDVISINKIREIYIACCCFLGLDLGSKECIMLNNEHTVCLEICHSNANFEHC